MVCVNKQQYNLTPVLALSNLSPRDVSSHMIMMHISFEIGEKNRTDIQGSQSIISFKNIIFITAKMCIPTQNPTF